jgi:hypothetical protein
VDKGEIMWFAILKQLSPNPQNLMDLTVFIARIPPDEIIEKKWQIVHHDIYGIPEDEAQALDAAIIKTYLDTEDNTFRSHTMEERRTFQLNIAKRLIGHTPHYVGGELVTETMTQSTIKLSRIGNGKETLLINLLLKADGEEYFDEWDRILGE